jgi:hypothetical protein
LDAEPAKKKSKKGNAWLKTPCPLGGTFVVDEIGKSLGAHCGNPAHGQQCRFNRVFNKSPMGALGAWLSIGMNGTKAEHQAAKEKREDGQALSYCNRCDSRGYLELFPELKPLFDLEKAAGSLGVEPKELQR